MRWYVRGEFARRGLFGLQNFGLVAKFVAADASSSLAVHDVARVSSRSIYKYEARRNEEEKEAETKVETLNREPIREDGARILRPFL